MWLHCKRASFSDIESLNSASVCRFLIYIIRVYMDEHVYFCVCMYIYVSVVVLYFWNTFQKGVNSNFWLPRESPQKLLLWTFYKKDPRANSLFLDGRESKNLSSPPSPPLLWNLLNSSLSFLGDYCTPTFPILYIYFVLCLSTFSSTLSFWTLLSLIFPYYCHQSSFPSTLFLTHAPRCFYTSIFFFWRFLFSKRHFFLVVF